ncbi:STAS domain-containing protein [Nocardia sp. XZ_19_385]|uniref:STAS domain-containing protein n=1 Tax=Nocardia sp. XZ_19_385 TaxID=2769488 RepID=UPI00188E96B9|nr:STAS domain-containing protein [Nocardia sp. XZ_19_385]
MSTVIATQITATPTKRRSATPKPPHPADRLRVSVTQPSKSVTLCAVAGEVDQFTAEDFRREVVGCLNTAAPIVVVDLAKVTFFGVAGLRVLLEARDWAGHTQRTLRLVTGPRCVDRLLEVASSTAAFEIVPDLATAVRDVA